ncbi:hypothetical protein [Brucella pituitosa]
MASSGKITFVLGGARSGKSSNLFMWAVIGLALGWFIQTYAKSEVEG